MGLFLDSLGVQTLKKNHSLTLSGNFVNCANTKLSKLFEQLSTKKSSVIRWVSYGESQIIKGPVTKIINAKIVFKYGQIPLDIQWKNKSENLNESSENINCEDIIFEFQNFDIQKCLLKINPKWSLITFPENEIESLDFTKQKFSVSLSFFKCLTNQLTPVFEKAVGFKVDDKVSLNIDRLERFVYVQGPISKLNFTLYINHNWNPVVVLWRSKSGREYKIDDEYIDCNDIEFSFAHLDVALYIQQMFPAVKLPFKLKDLTYKLVVTRINLDCTLDLKLKPAAFSQAENIVTEIANFIEDWNIKSEKNDRKDGVIHNSFGSFNSQDSITYEMDLGSVGWPFFKKLLLFLSKKDSFIQIEIK